MTGAAAAQRVAEIALTLAAAATVASGQLPAPATAASAIDCPVVGGVRVTATARDTGVRAAPRDLLRIDRRSAVDTTFTFHVVERRWSLSELAASVAAGVADTVRGRWNFCAGAAVGLHRPTIVIHGARGQIRLRASLRELALPTGTTRPEPDRTRAPPRRT